MTNYQLANLLHVVIGRVQLQDLEHITRCEREAWDHVHITGTAPDDKTMSACLRAINNMLEYDRDAISRTIEGMTK